jgi:Uma2 family endonuclease
LAIEVLSPDDEAGDMLDKIADYPAAGISHIRAIDPYKRRVMEADRSGIRHPANLVLATPLVVEVDFAAVPRT